jgi:hypothetical protein
MEVTFVRLDELQWRINIEKCKYKHAIENNLPFEVIKGICHTVSKMEAEVLVLMKEINERYHKTCNWKK